MKIRLFIGIILLMCVLPIGAQKDFKPELYIGVGAGSLFSSVDFAPNKIYQDLQLGYYGGIAAKYIGQKNLGIVAEVNYAKRGWIERFSDNPEYAYSRILNYIEVPFMTHVYAGKRNTRFIFNVGPQLGVLLSDNSTMSNALATHLGEQKNTMQYLPIDSLTRVDYGLVAGMGMELKTKVGDFDLEGRYYFGLGDIFPNRQGDYFSRSAHRIFEAKLTYYIRLK